MQEINRHINPTFVPLMAAHVRGVVNLRGNLVTVIDLGHVVCGQATQDGPRTRTVVDLGARRREALPSHLPAAQRQWFTGLVQLPNELLLLLDVDAVARFGLDSSLGVVAR